MVAALLTKITTTNDLQHDALQRNQVHLRQAEAQARHQEERQRREKEGQEQESSGGGGRGRAGSSSGSGGGAGTGNGAGSGSGREVTHSNPSSGGHMSPLSSSVLAFHGKNVPAITILSYLTRIHKYCPTTYEVFLSLLVYFDRMTERVNDMVVKSEEERRRRRLEEQQQARQARQEREEREKQAAARGASYEKGTADDPDVPMRDTPGDDDDNKAHDSDETDSDLADDDDEEMADEPKPATGFSSLREQEEEEEEEQATYFVVDSFNIHRLIIAGVTCASKFFSDVFYTNSRYAKVCLLSPFPFLAYLPSLLTLPSPHPTSTLQSLYPIPPPVLYCLPFYLPRKAPFSPFALSSPPLHPLFPTPNTDSKY